MWSELGDMGSPHWVQVWLFTVNDICGIEKSAMIGPKVLSQATPNMMSAPSTGRINNGIVNVVWLSSKETPGKNPLHSRCCPFPTITVKGVILLGSMVISEAILG